MLNVAVAVARKIWRQICRQIFRQSAPLTLPVPAYPRGRESGAVPGVFVPPPDLHPTKPKSGLAGTPELPAAVAELIDQVLERRWLSFEVRNFAGAVIARFRELVGDLPASANHHHSEPYGLLQHTLEVALKMLENHEGIPAVQSGSASGSGTAQDALGRARQQYVCFLAGICHDLGKLMEMEVREGGRHWYPPAQTYGEFCLGARTRPLLTWSKDRVRGAHASLAVLVIHHVLCPADEDYLGREGLKQLLDAIVGTHKGDKSNPLAHLLRRLDQKSVEEAAPDWMLKQPDSKVNQFIRALRALIENGELSVSSLCAQVYVTGDKAAVVVPVSILAAREFLKRENIKLPPNHRLYDLMAQAKIVEADENRQCVKRIRVPGKHGPVELSAVIFQQSTIIPQQILPTLPKVTFEIVPEEPKPVVTASSGRPRVVETR